jgi:hypothetical protein
MSGRYPKVVRDAVAEALASGLKVPEIRTKLRAGTLPGIDGPTEVPRRTVYACAEELRRGRSPTRQDEPSPLVELVEHWNQVKALVDAGATVEEVFETTDIPWTIIHAHFREVPSERFEELIRRHQPSDNWPALTEAS